jgi:hypothetical protein
MSKRAALAAFAVVAVAGLGGLLASATADQQRTAFSLGVPAGVLAPYLDPGQTACQGPINPTSAYRSVRAWTWPGYPPNAVLRVSARNLAGTVLATGRIVHTNTSLAQQYPSPQAETTRLTATLPAGRRITVCFQNVGSTVVSLLGGTPTNTNSGVLTIHGKRTAMALSLLFLGAHPSSLLSQVPKIFSRASLFRPTWVGPWTFWLLALALVLAFPLAAVAVARASSAR